MTEFSVQKRQYLKSNVDCFINFVIKTIKNRKSLGSNRVREADLRMDVDITFVISNF